MRSFFFIIFMIIFSVTLYSGRPLTTDDAEVVEKNKCEIEMGFNFTKFRNNEENQSIDYSIKIGISKRLDAGFSFSEEIPETLDFSPIEFSMKINFFQNKKFLPDISTTFNISTGDSIYRVNYIMSKEIKKFIFHLNFGFLIDPFNHYNKINYSLATEFLLNKKVELVSEIFSEYIIPIRKKEAINCLIGGNLQLTDKMILDMGLIFNSIKSGYSGTTGITIEL